MKFTITFLRFFCYRFSIFRNQYFLQLTLWRQQETSMFLAVDPNMQNRLRAKEMENGRVDIGPTDLNLGYFTDAYYELKGL